MDQYVVKFEFAMLYFDMLDMIQVLKDSDNKTMIEYAEYLQQILDEESKQDKLSK